MGSVQSVYVILSRHLSPEEVTSAFSRVRAEWSAARIVTSKETRGDHSLAISLAERVVVVLPESRVLSPSEHAVLSSASLVGRVRVLIDGVLSREWVVETVDGESVAGSVR